MVVVVVVAVAGGREGERVEGTCGCGVTLVELDKGVVVDGIVDDDNEDIEEEEERNCCDCAG